METIANIPGLHYAGGNSPEDICRAIAEDFKARGLSHAAAARMLGVDTRSVSNQISGKRPFGKKSAQRYARVFGYDEPYLLYGIGTLKRGDTDTLITVEVKPGATLDDSTAMLLLKRIADLENQLKAQKAENESLKRIRRMMAQPLTAPRNRIVSPRNRRSPVEAMDRILARKVVTMGKPPHKRVSDDSITVLFHGGKGFDLK